MYIYSRAVNFFWRRHVAWSFSFDCMDVAEDLTNVTVVSTEFNDVDDEIDGLVIGPTLSILSKKMEV